MNNNKIPAIKKPVQKNTRTKNNKKKIKRNSKVYTICYLSFVAVLLVLIGVALLYVNSVIKEYKNEQPQIHLDKALESLRTESKSGKLWEKEGFTDFGTNEFETSLDPKSEFTKMINDESITFSSPKALSETDYAYGVMYDNNQIAEIVLRKIGEPYQKLLIINIQKYELISYAPITHDYTIELPKDVYLGSDLFITVNDIPLNETHTETRATGETIVYLNNMFMMPKVEMKDAAANSAEIKYPITSNGKIEYNNTFYDLTIPDSLTVNVNGVKQEGEPLEDGRIKYRVRLVADAKVELTDRFKNTIEYKGTTTVPLSYYTFETNGKCTVTVNGVAVPQDCITTGVNEEFDKFKEYVTNPDALPKPVEYKLVVLDNEPNIVITDDSGNTVEYDKKAPIQDLTAFTSGVRYDTVPEEIAAEINVLKVLEDWSFFMSCDLNFNGLSKHLIKNSHLYDVAWKYNNSIDRTFISVHGLTNPPFTEESVTNFVWLADNCFSVDIHFVKNMIVSGKLLPDEMNERCYFVKYDTTNDKVDNPTWKFVGMKEIVDNAE